MNAATRRKTDPRSDSQRLAELTTEQRQLAFMWRLSAEVATACDKWLRGRGIKAGSLCGEYPRHTVQSPHKPSSTQETGTSETDTPPMGGGGLGTLARTDNPPRRVPASYTRRCKSISPI